MGSMTTGTFLKYLGRTMGEAAYVMLVRCEALSPSCYIIGECATYRQGFPTNQYNPLSFVVTFIRMKAMSILGRRGLVGERAGIYLSDRSQGHPDVDFIDCAEYFHS